MLSRAAVARRVAILLLGMWLALLATAGRASAPPSKTQSDEQFERAVHSALWWGDFPALRELHRESLAEGGADETGARSRFRLFLDGIDGVLDDLRSTRPVLQQLAQRLAELEAAEPDEPLWPSLRANVMVKLAWLVRGRGYANTVLPQAFNEFHGLLRQAMDHLAAKGEMALRSPLAHTVLIGAGQGLSLPRDRLEAILDDGLRRHPRADSLIVISLNGYMPKWGGDERAVDRFILRYAPNMAYASVDEAYALLYAMAARQQFSHQLFERSRAHWPRMRTGYRSMLARQDSAAMRQNAAYMACLAQDREAYLEFSARGMQPLLVRQWGTNGSATADSCRRWGASQ